MIRIQFLLRLAYAVTFNSCQGQTLKKAIFDLRQDIFVHGQLYTALTRIRSRKGGTTLISELNKDFIVRNVVFRQLVTGI